MELNIILWTGGMLFTLSIFAVKVGFGLGFSGMRWKGMLLTLFLYLMLFVAIAMLSGHLIKLLEPVLQRGPYLHALMAIGMIIWGILLLRDSHHLQSTNHKPHSVFRIPHSALLLIPCPVCFTAMTFSTWAALNVIKLPSPVVGLGLGCVFVLLSLLFLTLSRLRKSANPRISLGLCMITIGCYFLATLILPAKIEEAKEIYKSFIVAESSRLVENTKRDASSTIDLNNNIGVLALLFSSILIGFFGKQRADT